MSLGALQARQDVLMRQMRVVTEQVGFRPARTQHLQDQLNRDSRAADDRLSSKHLRVQDDTILPVHARIVTSSTLGGMTYFPIAQNATEEMAAGM